MPLDLFQGIRELHEGEVHADIDGTVAAEGHTLLGKLADGAVHADEEIETFDVNICKPSEAYAISSGGEVGGS